MLGDSQCHFLFKSNPLMWMPGSAGAFEGMGKVFRGLVMVCATSGLRQGSPDHQAAWVNVSGRVQGSRRHSHHDRLVSDGKQEPGSCP